MTVVCAMLSELTVQLRVLVLATSGIQGGPAKVKPTYFTHQNAQAHYYSTVLFYKKTGSYSQKYYKRKTRRFYHRILLSS